MVPDLERIGNPDIRLYRKPGSRQYHDSHSNPNIVHSSHEMVRTMTVESLRWPNEKENYMKKLVVAYDHIQKDLVIIPLIRYRPQRKIQKYRSRYEPVDNADTVLEAQDIMRTVKNMGGVSEYLKINERQK